MLGFQHLVNECPAIFQCDIGIAFIGRVFLGFRESDELKALASQEIEELRKHHGLEAADVQKQDVLYIAAIKELGRCLAESDVLSAVSI